MTESQKLNVNSTVRLNNMEEKLSEMKGELEESRHLTNQRFSEKINKMDEELKLIQENQKAYGEFMVKQEKETKAIQAQLKENKKYLNKLLSSLSKVAGIKKPSKKKKSVKRSAYDQAMWNYKKRKYKTAKTQLMDLLDSKKIKGNRRARILHNLGMIQYMAKKYDESKVYFSRLYTEHPKAPYNPNGLLFLGKIFQKTKENEQAKQTFSVLVKSYPKAKQTKEARKILAKLK